MALEAPPNRSFDTQDEAIQFLIRDYSRVDVTTALVSLSSVQSKIIVYKVNI